MSQKKGVLFVCLGNICRSPIAEAVFAHLVKERGLTDKWFTDSAGTGMSDHSYGVELGLIIMFVQCMD